MVNQKIEAVKTEVNDVIVIGAGPHSLAISSRMLEKNPSAIYTDLEHARLSWLNKYKRLNYKPKGFKRKLVNNPNDMDGLSVRVFDKHVNQGWMPHWYCMFENLEIRSLRSPMFFHSSPRDVDALLAYAYSNGRQNELQDIPGVVGKELSKHAKKRLVKTGKRPSYEDPVNERYVNRQDFRTPGSKCFFDFCREDIQQYYGIDSLVQQADIVNLEYDYFDENIPDKIFRLTGKDGRQTLSKTVVMAIGNNTIVNLPSYLADKVKPTTEHGVEGDGWCHTSSFARPGYDFPNKHLRAKSDARLLVVGGGLTSAQIIDKAYRNGITNITLICRSHLKMKPFDFDTEWVDKFQNLSKMIFWREDCRQMRHSMISKARNGGSVNAPYYKLLKDLENKGVLKILTCTEITEAKYNDSRWDVKATTKTAMRSRRTSKDSSFGDMKMENHQLMFDYIVSATGSKIDINEVDFLKKFMKENPIETTNGLPHITEDLQWTSDIPLFVMGGFASLELGPSSFNLGGSRDGAERIANRMNEILVKHNKEYEIRQSKHSEYNDDDLRYKWMERLALNNGGYFDLLTESDE
ncbi:hypothetical protein E3Q01_01324 [Wallemia mellicola]|uniref:L-ornithine N(5)-monooxygenase [NAD(P)H] n=1 Tax=Wallemia mellicola TaxID=1708541 RepID=A0A4T0T170_9BASI|nr:hypothetical protein E3Q05_00958 [Wallemia mellicola]TIC67261.1 hypothetical protein E3Q01_01324 [Wallemia mellicola]